MFAQNPFVYPPAHKDNVVDDYHGTRVPDPYRWLENPDTAESRSWIEAENKVTFGFLEKIPAREKIRDRITKLWNFEKYGPPEKEGPFYFYFKNNGLQNQSVLYVGKSLDETPRVLLDPNSLSPDGTVALSATAIREDGKYLAYSLSSSGSDWQEWKVRDVETGQDLSDDLKWVKFSGASWTKDGKGFYYSRFDEPKEHAMEATNYFQKLYYHKLGTPQSEDVLVYERPDRKEWQFAGTVTEDGRYLVITVTKGTDPTSLVFYKDLQAPEVKAIELISTFEAEYSFINNEGPLFWFKTNFKAPRGRIIGIDIREPQPDKWKEVVPESSDAIDSFNMVNNRFIISYLKDAHSQVKVFSAEGKPVRSLELSGLGTATGFGGKKNDKETFYSYTSYSTPGTIYRYDLLTGKSTLWREPKLDFRPADFQTKQIFYTSKDGTRVPMFISYKKGVTPGLNTPALLYGYGGFDISMTPAFSVTSLVWMEMGGIYAVPNLRGGGEYGEEWHHAGTKLHKQNVFDDFIAAAEWLIANKYTSTPRLAISGGSNGGLLVGACLTQRPELFGATLPAVGVMDMLRFHKFTIGWAWVDDYGSSDNAEEFKAIYAYSPLHHIKPGTKYPPTLITTADHDDRVVPAHSFKFAAAMQAAQAGPAPVLIRIDVKAGHGAGKPTTKVIEEAADRLAFLVQVMNLSV